MKIKVECAGKPETPSDRSVWTAVPPTVVVCIEWIFDNPKQCNITYDSFHDARGHYAVINSCLVQWVLLKDDLWNSYRSNAGNRCSREPIIGFLKLLLVYSHIRIHLCFHFRADVSSADEIWNAVPRCLRGTAEGAIKFEEGISNV